jgi:ACS family hexuronate transporter-like MFS transporter
MGKLGGQELNYSSDIDLVFVCQKGSERYWGLGQRLIRGGMSLDRSRKIVIWIGALLVPVALPAVTADSAATAIALIAAAMFAMQFKASSLFTLPADLFPARDVGTVWGLFGAIGSFGAMAFNAVVGWTIDHFSYQPVFAAVAVMHILSAAMISLFIPQVRQLAPAGSA